MFEVSKKWEGQTVQGTREIFPLRRRLGGSEHSAVFLTERRGSQGPQRAAIKVVKTDGASAGPQLARWKAAEKLAHPNLLQVYETGRCQVSGAELLYMVMEYAEEDISQVLPERALTAGEARDMLVPTLDALAYLHRQSFVHGHLKPANIMAVGDKVKLASDDLYRKNEMHAGNVDLTAYDAPEKLSAPMSQPVDVWSLGMSLVEVLTQKRPEWKATDYDDPAVAPNLPAPFFDIIRNCLRRDPQRRWTVAEIAARIQPVLAIPPRKSVSPGRPTGIRRLYAPAAVAMVVIAAILGGWQLLVPRPATDEDTSTVSATGKAKETEPSAPKPAAGTQQRHSPNQPAGSTSAHTTLAPRSATPPNPPRAETTTITPSGSASPAMHVGGASQHAGVVREVMPNASQQALDTIRGRIRVSVRVHVDPSGNVTGAELDSAGPSRYFAQRALEAAQGWKFAPGQTSGRDWLLHFEFTNSEVKAYPAQGGL